MSTNTRIKNRALVTITAIFVALTFCGLGMSAQQAWAADGDYPVPDTSKVLIDNEDGTYTLKLSVTGSAKTETENPRVNVIFIMDRSGSMANNNSYTGQSGYAVTQYGRYGHVGTAYPQLYYRGNNEVYYEVGNNDNHATVYTRSGSPGNYTYTQYSGTRYYQVNNMRRDQVAIAAASNLADDLLSYNTAANPDIVEMAFVSFNDMATNGNGGNWTTSQSTAQTVIRGYTGQTNTGTNWEDALIHAKALADAKHTAQPDEQMFVIFLTDGNPTRYVNNQGQQAGNGQETTDNINTCYNEAAPRALALTNAGYELYNIGVFGSVDRMENLTTYANGATAEDHGSATYYAASNASALEAAFAEILREITDSLSLADVKFTDGVTDMTHSTGVNGRPDNFKYTITVNGVEEPWDDAPLATVNDNKEVIWDLSKDNQGEDLTIADGVTVTCSFLVWPDQDAMDLIADLNNNVVSYDSLTDAQKAQITGTSPGNYALKTNTEARLDYSILEDRDGDIHKIPQDPITLDPPEPMPLFIDKLSLEKKWDDSLDPEQREEVEGKVVLDFYKDNTIYTLPGYEDGIPLEEANSWKLEDFLSIATGIMVSEKSPAYDADKYPVVTYDGKSYCILEIGHDYHFQEQDINDHYELTAYTYHPMLVDGVLHNLTFEYDGDDIVGVTEGAEISTVSATNTIKGGVSITKKVVDEDGEEIDSGDPFTITMHMVTPEGEPYSYDYRIYYGEKNPKYGTEDVTPSRPGGRSPHIYGEGDVTIEIYPGDEIRFVNVNDDTRYYVEEADPQGYELDGITYQIRYGDDPTYVDFTDDQKVTIDGKTYYIMQGNSSAAVGVTNIIKKGDLKVTKTVVNGDTNKDFEFTLELKDESGAAVEGEYNYTIYKASDDSEVSSGKISNNGKFTLKDGQYAIVKGLPGGTEYTVTETAVAGYTADKTGDTGTIEINGTKTAAFTNTYDAVGKAELEAIKDLSGAAWPAGKTLTFTLAGTGGTLPADKTATLTAPGTATFDAITYGLADAGETYTYTITEDGFGDGWTGEPDEITATVKVTDNGDGTLATEITYDPEDKTFTNTYEAEGTAVLQATKAIEGAEWPEDATITFTLAGEGGTLPETKTVTLTEPGTASFGAITYDESDAGETYTYTITEDGFGGAWTGTPDEITATVKVTDNGDGTLATEITYDPEDKTFTNTYAAEGSVVLQGKKVAEGFDLEAEQFSFELKDVDGTVLQTKKNDADGNFAFDAITYDEFDAGKTFTYTINEVVIEGDDIVDDTHVTTVTVKVTDNGDGTLTAVPTYSPEATFTNTHEDNEKEVTYGEVQTNVDGHLVQAGEVLTYTIKYVNNTDKVATVTVEDTIPQYTEYNGDASPAAEFDGTKLTWTIEGVQPGATGEVTFSVTVNSDAKGVTIENDADVRDGENESTTNLVTTSIPVKEVTDESGADIDGEGVQVGDVLTYNVSFKIGEDGKPVTAATVKDTIPAGTEYVPGSAEADWATSIDDSGDAIVWTFEGDEDNPLAAGTYTATFQVKVTEDALALATKTINNTAIINVNDDPDVETNTVTNTPEVGDLTISKEITVPEGLQIDEEAEFTFTVKLWDKTETELVGEYKYTGDYEGTITSGGTITLKDGESVTIEGLPAGGIYEVEETVIPEGYEVDGDNPLTGEIVAGEAVTAAFNNLYSAEGEAEIVAKKVAVGFDLEADQFSFELKDVDGTVLQTKTNDANGDVTFDAITYVAEGTYLYTITEVVTEGDDIADDTHVCNVTVTVVDNHDGTLTATVDNGDNVFTNTHEDNEKDVFTFSTQTSVDGELVEAGDILTYTITYANNTGGEATVTVEDTIPANTSYVDGSADPEADFDGTKLTWTIEGVAAGATGTVTFQVTVDEAAKDVTIENEAVVNDGENENTTNAVTTSVPVKDVKDDSGASIDGEGVQVGDTLTYEVKFTITEDAESVIVTDKVPEHTTLVDGSIDNGGTESGGTITWDLGAKPAGTYTVSFKVTVDESAVTVDAITNTANISVNDHPGVDTNVVTNTPEVGGLTVSKTIEVPEGYEVDENAEFTFTITLKDKNDKALTGEYKYTGDYEGTLTSGGTFTLKDGESIVVEGLPAGAKYAITEADKPGYKPAKNPIEGTIEEGETASATAAFVNAYTAEPAEVDPPVQKVLDVPDYLDGPDSIEGAFTFTIVNSAKPDVVETAPMPENTSITNSAQYLLPGETDLYEFGEIEFTVPGDYTYTVTESGSVPGVTNDPAYETGKTIKVSVSDDDHDGKLKATMDPEAGKWVFTNTYDAEPASVYFEAMKDLSGTPLTAGAFEFELKDADDKVIQEKTNGADGTVTFDFITYDKPGTYTYTIVEVDGGKGGYAYDGHEIDVTVTVTDNKKGELVAEVAYDGDKTFVNTYEADGSWMPTAAKELKGRTLEADQFKFELLDEDGNVIQTKTNNKSGAVQFDEISYDQTIFDEDEEADEKDADEEKADEKDADEEKASEKKAADGEAADEADADADEAEAEADATVDDKAAAEADATVDDGAEADADAAADDEAADEGTTAEATTEAADADSQETADEPAATTESVSILPQAFADEFDDSKVFAAEASDAPMADDEAADDGATEPAAALKAAAAENERTKTFKYTIREVNEGKAGYTYDGHEVAITVTVTDNGDGTLKVEPVYDGDTTFVNTYKATGEATFAATKAVTGATLAAGQFSFQLKDADGAVLQTKTNDASGAVAFDAVAFTEADAGKSIEYSIIEVNDAQAGYTYDSHVATATVTVTDNGDGTLSTAVKYSDGDAASFTNPYKPLATSAPFKAVKKLEGRDQKAGEFTFQLADQGGNVVAEATNAADGTVDFGYIGFDEPGTYTFTATEVKGTDSAITYDTSTKTYTVEVTDEAGQLVAKVTCEGAETATFTNKYTPPSTPSIPTKSFMPSTGDSLPIVALIAAAIAAAATCGVALRRRALAARAERHASHSYYGRKR